MDHQTNPNEWSREVWNANAAFWNEHMGEGNDFVNVLTWPAVTRLMGLVAGERVLDVACGNGLTSRRLAAAGGQVLAVDFAAQLIALAKARTVEHDAIEYRQVDATDEEALLSLGQGTFDAILCNMAIFDMAEIRPLMRVAARLLRPGGRFVFSTGHPCFNSARVIKVAEEDDTAEGVITRYSLKIYDYLTPSIWVGHALRGQPEPQPYFHRSLQEILGEGFRAGLVLDGLEERAFPADFPAGKNPLSWGANFSEFPPVLVARMRPAAY